MPDSYKILDAVTQVTGISLDEILGRARLWPIVEARLLYVLCCSSFRMHDSVAASVLHRNRTTILNARRRAQGYKDCSKVFSEKYAKILSLL